MFVFIVANLPLPLIFYLNLKVTLKFLRVRRLSGRRKVPKPERLVFGWWLCNISTVFVLVPVISERRFFVQNHWWLVSYTIAATLSICGLILMNSGLGQEIRLLSRRRRPRGKSY
jgi:hypothetical protein